MHIPQIVEITPAADHYGGPWDGAKAIVLHHTGGTDSRAWLSRTSQPPVSVHVLIAKDGTIYRIVPDGQQAYHVGFSVLGLHAAKASAGSCNEICLGIELENLGDGHDPFPDLQIDAAAWQIAQWWRTYGGLPILTHALIDTNGKTDPLALDLVRVYRAAVAWYDGQPTKPAPARGYSGTSPLLGQPQATAEQCIAYLLATPTGDYNEYSVRMIVNAYFAQASLLGLDPVLAIAQLCKETGWNGAHGLNSFWSQRPQRNPAGIGVNGEKKPATEPDPGPGWKLNTQRNQWERGLSFDTWVEHAIPAHLGRLLAYALTDNQATPAQREAIDDALTVRPLPADKRGIAPVLDGLGGTWAKDVGYGGRVAEIAELIRKTSA